MEAFSLLKYWKSSSAATRGGLPTFPAVSTPPTTTILAAGDFDSDEDAADDEGPFIDLEFAVPEEEEGTRFEEDSVEFGEIVDDSDVDDDVDHHDVDDADGEDDDDDDGGGGKNESADSNVGGVSPSEEVLFNGQIVRFSGDDDEEIASKSGQIPIPASFLRSATKFRVLMLKLKRSKSDQKSNSQTQKQTPKHNNNNRKLFTVKFKVEEVPVISLLSRASSNSKSTTTTPAAATTAVSGEAPSPDSGDEKRNKKEVIQKYLKLVKPLYIRVSKRHHPPPEKTAATAEEEAAEKSEVKAANPPPPPTTTCSVSSAFTGSGQKVSSVVGLNLKGMIMAKKHLGKSKSAIVHSNSSSMQKNGSSNRRDDSLLEQQDGIQGAILHCKRSFNSSTQDSDSENKEDSSVLTRSASDPSHEKKRTTVKEEKNDVVALA